MYRCTENLPKKDAPVARWPFVNEHLTICKSGGKVNERYDELFVPGPSNLPGDYGLPLLPVSRPCHACLPTGHQLGGVFLLGAAATTAPGLCFGLCGTGAENGEVELLHSN